MATWHFYLNPGNFLTGFNTGNWGSLPQGFFPRPAIPPSDLATSLAFWMEKQVRQDIISLVLPSFSIFSSTGGFTLVKGVFHWKQHDVIPSFSSSLHWFPLWNFPFQPQGLSAGGFSLVGT